MKSLGDYHGHYCRRHDDDDEVERNPQGERSAIDDRRMLGVPQARLGGVIGFHRQGDY